MNIVSLIIEAISGAVGGNVAGAAMKDNLVPELCTIVRPIRDILCAGSSQETEHPRPLGRRHRHRQHQIYEVPRKA